MASLKPLLLAGGLSSRTGTRKELLCLEDNEPMYKRLISILHAACPESDTAYLSLRDRSSGQALYGNDNVGYSPDVLLKLDVGRSTLAVQLIYDSDDGSPRDEDADIGPAAGLLSAHRQDPSAVWLVVACDYPFLTTAALQSLRQESEFGEAPVTCFSNAEGFNEPLLAIWTPDALHYLQKNVEQWLFNTNNWDEWQRALDMTWMD